MIPPPREPVMKKPLHHDTAFRTVFIGLVLAVLLLWAWNISQQPAGPSRVDWPAHATAASGSSGP